MRKLTGVNESVLSCAEDVLETRASTQTSTPAEMSVY